MPEYIWICLNKQDPEYASSPNPKSLNMTKVLNMAGFSICERCTAFWICQNMPWQSSGYISRLYMAGLNMQELRKVLNMSLNMAEYVWIYDNRQGYEYVSCNT